MTITLSPRTELLLREKAALSGQEHDTDSFADSLLAETLKNYRPTEGESQTMQYGSDQPSALEGLTDILAEPELLELEGETAIHQRTLADRLAGKIGKRQSRRGAGGSDAAERTGELFTQGMLRKRAEGHL